MKKAPKPNWSSFTKAELIKTIKKLDARQTKLLNELGFEKDKLEATQAVAAALQRRVQELEFAAFSKAADAIEIKGCTVAGKLPWEMDQ